MADDWFNSLGIRERRMLWRALQARAGRPAGAPPEHRGRHRARPHIGPDPDLRSAFGFFGFGGGGGRFGAPFARGPKARRGDVRAAALLLLAESSRNGYQLMQEIENRSGGLWRPSPGSMYPVLQQLEDEGLVRPEGHEGRRLFSLTDEGRAYVASHAEELGTPWQVFAESVADNAIDCRSAIHQVVLAAVQVMRAGDERHAAEALEVLADTRRRLYRILAEDDASEQAEEQPR
ncbi:MAG TPA: PadR family transcriptional regulator [Candidatus Dormibacteraeota bacterium]|nr:PadR family transcriptional regulator [Candidatus Dormibacteraeota bacterium]